MSNRDYQAEYKRWRRANDPEYAQRSREQSLAAKRRRRGVCERCGGETKYNGHGIGVSKVCADCSRQEQHDERHWTRERIVRAFIRFRDETGRVPRVDDAHGPCESIVIRLSGRRIRELEQVRELGLVLPSPQFAQREFGSWTEALRAAGMRPSVGGAPTHRPRAWDRG